MADLFPTKPLSPHLSVYRISWLMAASIVHRITGASNYFGMALVAWWLASLALGPDAYQHFADFALRWPGRLIVFGYTWSLVHHMFGGFRYLIWDTGRDLEIHVARRMAIVNFIGSIVLTIILWALGTGVHL